MQKNNFENNVLTSAVFKENELKKMLVNYVGNKINPKDDQVTVEMILEVLSKEFPEFILALAEENFIRGYEQALADVESETPAKKKKRK